MKNQKNILSLKVLLTLMLTVVISLILVSFASAYPVRIGVNSLDGSNFNSVVYHCTNSAW